MRQTFLIFLSVIILTSCAHSPWTKYDTARQFAVTGTLLADWDSTRYCAENPNIATEYNPILGTHPSPDAVDNYFLSWILIHPLISYFLPSQIKNNEENLKIFNIEVNPRALFQYFTITLEGFCIIYNYQ